MPTGRTPEDAASVTVIGRGAHGTVALDRSTMTVEKRLRGRFEASGGDLRREFDHLRALSAALRPYPWLRCPKPLEIDARRATLRMTYCPGTAVDALLAHGDPVFDDHHEHVAEQIRTAVEVYVATFGEPYTSLSPSNLIFDPGERVLYLVDFTKSRAFAGIDGRRFAVEVSLACFLARVMHQAHGPRTLWNRALRLRSERILRSVVHPLAGRHALDLGVVLRVSRVVRHALTQRTRLDRRPHVWVARALWYRALGNPLAARRAHALLTPRGARRSVRLAT